MSVRELKWDIIKYQDQIEGNQVRIRVLERKIEQLEPEYRKQTELQKRQEEFFMAKKEKCEVLRGDARGKAIENLLAACCDVYSVSNSNELSQSHENIKNCIRHNIEMFMNEIEELSGENRSLNSRIKFCEKEIDRIQKEKEE